MPEDQIDAALAQANQFEQHDDTGEVVVWAENWDIVEVFTHCRWRTALASGMGGAVRLYEGIDATEVLAVCELLGIPPPARREVLWGVGEMQRVALPELNREH